MDCGHAGSLRHLASGPEEKLAKCITGGLGAEGGSSVEHRWVLPSAPGVCLQGCQESLELGTPNGGVQVTCFLLLHMLGARFAGLLSFCCVFFCLVNLFRADHFSLLKNIHGCLV